MQLAIQRRARARARLTALLVLASAAAASAIYAMAGFGTAAALILLGLAYGYVIHRGRLCFANAMYGFDLTLTRSILYGLLTASVGSYLVVDVFRLAVPAASPAGVHTLIGSLLFGMGMPLAGGCLVGVMFRLGGGSTQSAVAFVGILLGGLVGALTAWPLADRLRTEYGIRPYEALGPAASLAVNIAAISALLALLYLRDSRLLSVGIPSLVRTDLRSPAFWATASFAGLWLAQFIYYGPLNTIAPLTRTAAWLSGASPPETWVAFVGGIKPPHQDPSLLLLLALITGSATSALLHGEFMGFKKVKRQIAARAFAGGLLMGFSAWLAVGCNISGFWSAAAQLRADGWLYALGLFAGAQVGLKLAAKIG